MKSDLAKRDDTSKSIQNIISPRSEVSVVLDDKTKEKVENYKKQIEIYRQDHDTVIQQMQMLKIDIKTYKNKYESLLNYDGRIRDYNDLKAIFMDLIDKYKPKYIDKITIRKDNEKLVVNKLLSHFQGDKK
jgi:hypothetical protein